MGQLWIYGKSEEKIDIEVIIIHQQNTGKMVEKFFTQAIGVFLIVNLQMNVLLATSLRHTELETAVDNDSGVSALGANRALAILLRVLIDQSVAYRLNELVHDNKERDSFKKHFENEYFVSNLDYMIDF